MPFIVPNIVLAPTGDTLADLLDDFFARGWAWMDDAGDQEARAKRWISQAQQEICSLAPWPFVEAEDSDTAPVSISDVRQIITVVDSTTGCELQGLDRDYLVNTTSTDLTTNGSPSWWYLDGNTLRVYPANTTDTITVRYLAVPGDLSDDTDIAVVPKAYTNIIIDLAVLRGLRSQDNIEEDSGLRAEVDRQVADMMSAELLRGESRYIRIHAGAEDW